MQLTGNDNPWLTPTQDHWHESMEPVYLELHATAVLCLPSGECMTPDATLCTTLSSALYSSVREEQVLHRELMVNVAISPRNNSCIEVALRCLAVEGDGLGPHDLNDGGILANVMAAGFKGELPRFQAGVTMEISRLDAWYSTIDGSLEGPATYIVRGLCRKCCIPEIILRCMQVSVSLMESGYPPERHHELIELVTSPETDFFHLFSEDQLQENSANNVFNSQAFLKQRSRSTNQPPDSMISQFLESQGFFDYLERGLGSTENGNNLLDKLQEAIDRGQNPLSILPSLSVDPEIITISDPVVEKPESDARYCYDRFPSNLTEEQEEKRKQILTAATGALEYSGKQNMSSSSVLAGIDSKSESLSPRERAAERERMVLDIKVKLQRLWVRLLELETTDDPLSSFEYGTILALIESDAEGIGGSGFVECIREHIYSGWSCQLTEEQFIAVKELLKTAIILAIARNDMETIRDALEVSAELHKIDVNSISDYVQRHLRSLSIWEELRFWEGYFDHLLDRYCNKSTNYATLVTTQLVIVAIHMAGLGLPDSEAWYMIETIAGKNNIGYKHIINLRGYLSHIRQTWIGYWGIYAGKPQYVASYGLPSPNPQDSSNNIQQSSEETGVGRSWVQSMFSRNRSISFTRSTSKVDVSTQDASTVGQKKVQTNIRMLRGHSGAVTALHCVTKRDVWDLVGDREDAGFFISGSTDCTVKIWDPSLRGSELRATLKGHSGTVRSISSDRGKVVSGSDDQFVLVWDKQTTQLLEELKGHDAQVSIVRVLSGERVLTASHDGTVKMWDVRTDTCVATVGRCSGAVLCMEYNDSTGILVAGGRDAVANIWDIRAGKEMHKLLGHSKWIRSLRMVGDTVITGSDDWTARVWSLSQGSCNAVLACHDGPVLCAEYSVADKGIITGSSDGLLRFWENDDGAIRCIKNVTIHSASILSINAGEQWLGIGAADNSMSLFHRPQDRLGGLSTTGSKIAGWQLYRTPLKSVAMVRCAASDIERKRICTGGRNGMVRLWDATINI